MRAQLTLVVLLTACTGVEPTAPPLDTEAAAKAFTSKMKLHFQLATDARSAVIKGELDGAKLAAKQLVELEPPTVPDPWVPHLDAMKAAAKDLSAAPTLEAAAQGVAELAAACGACHQQTGGGPRADIDKAMANATPPTEPHMAGHLWAADRMWLGLIGPSDNLYQSSAKVLAESHLHPKAEGDDHEGVPEEFVTLEKQIHELADSAATSAAGPERIKLYGYFLANCAACHSTFEIKPPI